MKKWIFAMALAVVLALVLADFVDVTQIVFTNYSTSEGFSVVEPSEITRITGAIALVPKQPCACEHLDVVLFKKPESEIYVSFCDHCFSIRESEIDKNYEYKMPKAFYECYQALLKQQTDKRGNPTRPSSATP